MLGRLLHRLAAADPTLRVRLGSGGQEMARGRFLSNRMEAEVEAHVADIVGAVGR